LIGNFKPSIFEAVAKAEQKFLTDRAYNQRNFGGLQESISQASEPHFVLYRDRASAFTSSSPKKTEAVQKNKKVAEVIAGST
jgi:hypothetical protein